jgi:hypothetical protein
MMRNTVNPSLLMIYFIADSYLLCRYLAAKSEADHYARELRREQEEIKSVPDTGFFLQ